METQKINGKIEIKNVSKIYAATDKNKNQIQALSAINLTINPGEFVCIVGTSGCGKSTLLRLIAGLEKSTDGIITLDNVIIEKPNSSIGMVFQDHSLFDWLTVKQNIIFALKASGKYSKDKQNKSQNEQLINTLLQKAELTKFTHSYSKELSGGMRQRAALIRSLAVFPDVLLLDEPLGALDSFTRMNLQNYIIELWQKHKNTMIMITHDIDEAVYLANKIIVMKPNPGSITQIIENKIPYPRNRANSEYVALRKKLLQHLNFASDEQQEYNL